MIGRGTEKRDISRLNLRRERTRISEQCTPISLTFTATTQRLRLAVRLSTKVAPAKNKGAGSLHG